MGNVCCCERDEDESEYAKTIKAHREANPEI